MPPHLPTLLKTILLMTCCPLPGLPAAPLIVAHRGASHDAPENTLAAFRLAWQQQADAIEGDFRVTQDGRIVCLHDATTERTAGTNLTVATTPFDTLRSLEVGGWKDPKWTGEIIPTLSEVLQTVPPGKKIFIEIKCGLEIMDPLRADLRRTHLAPGQIVIISFSQEVIAAIKESLPDYKAYWLTGYKQHETTGRWEPSLESVLGTLHQTGADGLDTQAQPWIDQAFVQSLRSGGFEFHAWTVDDPAEASRLRALGVDSITTNRPQWLRQQLQPSP